MRQIVLFTPLAVKDQRLPIIACSRARVWCSL